MPLIDSRTFRLLFVGSLITAMVAIVALTGSLLWPVWQRHRMVQKIVMAAEKTDNAAFLNAIDKIGRLQEETVNEDVLALLKHPNARVRAYAAIGSAALRSSPKAAIPSLIAILDDPSEEESVRVAAAGSLGGFGIDASDAVPALARRLKSNGADSRASTLALLDLEYFGVDLQEQEPSLDVTRPSRLFWMPPDPNGSCRDVANRLLAHCNLWPVNPKRLAPKAPVASGPAAEPQD